jgi:hypothetical protein
LKRIHRWAGAALAAGLLVSSLGCTGSGGSKLPQELALKPDAPFVLKGVSELKQVAQLTGNDSINKTGRYDVYGTDLGSMFNAGDKTYMIFGDTFGYRPSGMTGGGGQNWRSNTLAVTSDPDPSDGLTFDSMIALPNGEAAELLPSLKEDNKEMTKIPTYGISVGDSFYLYYMSVKHWGKPGEWDANDAGIAKSVDGGKTWSFIEGAKWPGDSNYIQVSAYKQQVSDKLAEIYFWCIPSGRFGDVTLMKVNEAELEDITKYVYFSGTDHNGKALWSANMKDAKVVVDDHVGVGELSVMWNPYLERWIMTYLKEGTGIVIREGIAPWGPWGEEITLVSGKEYPGLYGPYMNPKYVEENGKTIYFALSLWDPYNVFWMKASLEKKETP